MSHFIQFFFLLFHSTHIDWMQHEWMKWKMNSLCSFEKQEFQLSIGESCVCVYVFVQSVRMPHRSSIDWKLIYCMKIEKKAKEGTFLRKNNSRGNLILIMEIYDNFSINFYYEAERRRKWWGAMWQNLFSHQWKLR